MNEPHWQQLNLPSPLSEAWCGSQPNSSFLTRPACMFCAVVLFICRDYSEDIIMTFNDNRNSSVLVSYQLVGDGNLNWQRRVSWKAGWDATAASSLCSQKPPSLHFLLPISASLSLSPSLSFPLSLGPQQGDSELKRTMRVGASTLIISYWFRTMALAYTAVLAWRQQVATSRAAIKKRGPKHAWLP